jgi:DNA primase
MDVISLVQAGIKNVVASMGTALTKDQARTLKRYADKIYICYDGDSAGQKATIRGLEILSEEGLDVKVVSLPEGLDPDEVITKFGVEGYKKCLTEAKPLIDFKIDVLRRTFDINTVDGKRKFASSAIKVIKESPSATEQEDLLKNVQKLTNFTYEALKRELYSVEETKKEIPPAPIEINETDAGKEIMAARFVLSEYLFDRPYAKSFDINKIEFTLPLHLIIKDYINAKKTAGEKIVFNELYDMLDEEDKNELSRMAELITDDTKQFDRKQYFEDCVKILLVDSLNKKLERLKKLFKEETDVEKRRFLTKEMTMTLAEKSKISK